MTKERRRRSGDVMIVTKTRRESAIVDFADILNACKVEQDEDLGPPWEEHDGWDHDFTKLDNLINAGLSWRKVAMAYGWVSRPDRDGGPGLITVDAEKAGITTADHFRDVMGMSRQCAAEAAAEVKRNVIEDLVRWYKDGYIWYGVVCDFKGHHASLWGIQAENDDPGDPYLDNVKEEMAEEVAGELEKQGYTIVNRPVPEKPLPRAKGIEWKRMKELRKLIDEQRSRSDTPSGITTREPGGGSGKTT